MDREARELKELRGAPRQAATERINPVCVRTSVLVAGPWIRRHGHAFAALALLAMIVRAIVPAGYMLTPARAGELLTVTLCSGHGPVEALIDLKTGAVIEHQKKTPENSTASDAPCVSAFSAPLAAPEAPFSLLASFATISAPGTQRDDVAPGRGLAAPPPWATGPPITA